MKNASLVIVTRKIMKTIRVSTEGLLIIGLALLKLAIHFLTNTNYELHRDTYLYLALADHPDWGYVSVPPLTPMIGKLTITYNRTRQAQITKELIEIISGAEAL